MALIIDPLGENEAPRWRPDPKRAWRWLIDTVLPPRCPLCAVEIQEPGTVCPACWQKLRFISRPFCDKTATPFVIDPGPGIYAASAYQHPPDWDRARAAILYDDPAPALIHAFKYSDRHELLPLLANAMHRAGADLLAEADLLIPVPLHRARLWQRRFNQAALLAQRLAKLNGTACRTDLLFRRKPTPPQVGKSREARARNMAGAFAITAHHKPDIAGKRLILVDDVLTTGATLNACSRVLKAAGAANVDILVFARVGDPVALA